MHCREVSPVGTSPAGVGESGRTDFPGGAQERLLARRSIAKPDELAYYVCFGPAETALEELVKIAGHRWATGGCFEEAKVEVGLDQYEVRRLGWLVPARHLGLAGPRLSGGDKASGSRAARK